MRCGIKGSSWSGGQAACLTRPAGFQPDGSPRKLRCRRDSLAAFHPVLRRSPQRFLM
jgi:hypothetical protein